jgi:MFS family permease
MTERPRIFFGWYIIGLTITGMTLIYGLVSSFSVLFGPILDELKQPRGSTALMLSLNILVYGLTAPVAGILVDRWRPRTVAVIGIFTLAIATGLCYFADSLWYFYLLFGVIAPIGTSFCGSPILNPALINWFGKRRGLAIGLGQIGGGLSFAYGLLVEVVIAHWGWRPAFLVMAGTTLVVLLPLYFVFYYYHPREKGMQPYGSGPRNVEEAAPVFENTAANGWTVRAALKMPQLWFLILAQFFYWGIGNYLVIAHQVKFATDLGFSSILAASVFAMFGIVSIAGQVCASVSDIIGREKTVTIAVVLVVGAMVALMSVKDTSQLWLLYVYATCSGFATGLYTPQVFAGVADIFHGKDIGLITALLVTGLGIGGAIGPWLGGHIYDATRSYHIAFIVSLSAYVAAGICYWIAAPRNAEKVRADMEAGRSLFRR